MAGQGGEVVAGRGRHGCEVVGGVKGGESQVGGVKPAWRSWTAVCAGEELCGWLRLG